MDGNNQVNVGIIGCGNISGAYIDGCRQFEHLHVAAVTDLNMDAALSKAAEYEIPTCCTVDELLADPAIDIVINLTVPTAHAAVSQQIIRAGKHLYSEKPLAITRADGRAILDAAAAKGVRVGCAPDTFLGGGLQTCRKLIDDGAIGEPVAATAFTLGHGPEGWHPNPGFFYKTGAGPLFDMGPYYVTALVHLLGPVRAVAAMARISFAERTATSPAIYGQKLPVEVPTHVAGTLAMQSGPVATLITSFDVWGHTLPRIEIYGSEGSLSVPDPNTFWGPVRLLQAGSQEWMEVPLTHSDAVRRGVGVADMALAIGRGEAHRASGELAYHVLDVMQSLYDASDQERTLLLQSTCAQPEPLPVGEWGSYMPKPIPEFKSEDEELRHKTLRL
jgi:predicted dehydrogenase